jgi:hypothetical protein
VTQLVLPLHEAVGDLATAEPLHATTEATADPAAADSASESLHVATDPTTADAASIETSCLCVQV